MTIEALLESIDTKLGELIKIANTPAQAPAQPKPAKPKSAKETPAPTPTPEPTEPATDDSGFLDELSAETPAKELELADVRAVLVKLQTATNVATARGVLKDVGGTEVLQSLKKEKFAAVVKAAEAKMPK